MQKTVLSRSERRLWAFSVQIRKVAPIIPRFRTFFRSMDVIAAIISWPIPISLFVVPANTTCEMSLSHFLETN